MIQGRTILLSIICLAGLCACSPQQLFIKKANRNKSAYEEARNKLVFEDSALTYHSTLTWTEKEEQLNKRWKNLIEEMITAYRAEHFFPPASPFYLSKKHIESTSLFSILKQLPKGAILHLHASASGTADWIVDRAATTPNCFVYWPKTRENNTASTYQQSTYIKGQLHFFAEDQVPEGFIGFQQLDREVPSFKDSLRRLLVFDQNIFKDSVNIWGEFEKRFQRIGRFIRYQPVFEAYHKAALDSLIEDGIQHAELRVFLRPGEAKLYDTIHPDGYFSADTIIHYWQQIEQQLQEKDPHFSLRLIYVNLRFKDREYISADFADAFKVRKKYPEYVLGYDLVAHEDKGHSTKYFLDSWLDKDSLEKVHQIEMPLFLHDGESHWDVDNLYDALLLDSKRIGHGFNLYRYPSLFKLIKQQGIALEVNPLSNQILGYVRDLRVHPALSYLARGIPMTLSSDDPLIFDYVGMSYDYWMAVLAWELDLKQVKQLAYQSLLYSGLEGDLKARSIAEWEKRWDVFVDWANDYMTKGS